MHKLRLAVGLFITSIIFTYCKKDSISISPLASLNIVNACVNLGTVEANFTNVGSKSGYEYYSQISTTVAYGNNNNYAVVANKSIPLVMAPHF